MSKETKEIHQEGREAVDRRAFLKMVAGAATGAAVAGGMPEIAAAQRPAQMGMSKAGGRVAGISTCRRTRSATPSSTIAGLRAAR